MMTAFTIFDVAGTLAAVCVLAAFYSCKPFWIRLLSMGSSALFIVYAAGLDLTPVLVLHGLLLPLNAWRIAQVSRRRHIPAEVPQAPSPNSGKPGPLLLRHRVM